MAGEGDPGVVRDDRVAVRTGMTFHVRSHGAGNGPPLLFLHGVLNAAVSYDVLCRGLARRRSVIAIDQRGHGESDHAADYAWERWVEDIAMIVEALGLDSIDLVGHSMGAKHAARCAALHPGMVRRLALLEAGFDAPNSPSESDYWARIAQLFPADGFETLEDFVTLATRSFPRADPRILSETTMSFVRGENGRWSWPLQADLNLSAARTEPTPAEEHELRRLVCCPTLVAKAEHSELFTGNHFKEVAAEYAHGRHQLLPGTGHMVMWEAVNRTVAILDDFLN